MRGNLVFWFMPLLSLLSLQCKKEVRPNLFFSSDFAYEFSDVEKKEFFSGSKIVLINFPFYKRVCLIKLYPKSYVKIGDAFRRGKEIRIFLESVSGVVVLKAQECNFFFRELVFSDGELRINANGKLFFEVIDGEAKFHEFKIKKGQGYSAETREIYVLPREVKIIFPRDNAEVFIPLFLWEKIDKAKKYFLEIAIDENFLKPVFFSEIEDNKFFPQSLTLPRFSRSYFWRVWYELEDGRSSFYSEPKVINIPNF
ncbi:hypothetical protein HRbin19_01265 [bacterium HR19]|nr:hypothetical protein HRbin19_01265 [bacterium HR19]